MGVEATRWRTMKSSRPDPISILKALIYEHSGIHLSRKDEGVLKTRLGRRLTALALASAGEYVEFLLSPEGPREILSLLDAVTINYTFFFREAQSFQFLAAEALPKILARRAAGGPPRIRVWSAGCSSGEEPYSLAMTLAEAAARPQAWDFRVLATDINRRVLRVGARAVYPVSRLTGVPQEYHYKYLTRDAETPEDCLRVSPELREAVVFRRLNILEEVASLRNVFDVVLCRNVMIYFDEPTKVKLLRTFHNCLAPGGYLLLGASETLGGLPHPFLPAGPSAYRRR
jgi:chemotaxis protein methyltransferase CheR